MAAALLLATAAFAGPAPAGAGSPLPPEAAAADERWNGISNTLFHHFGRDQGLPNVFQTALAQDANGFLWIGTQGGLTRWDGYRFRNYLPEPNHPDSLPDNYVSVLLSDQHGRLWVGTSSGGLARYEPSTDRFTVYASGPDGISDANVVALAEDGANGVWVATPHGLDHVRGEAPGGTRISHLRSGVSGLSSDFITALLRDRAGNLWVGTDRGLVRSEDGGNHFEAVHVDLAARRQPKVEALFQDTDGQVWVGTLDRGVFVLDAKGNGSRSLEPAFAQVQLPSPEITAICEVQPGEIWIGTFGDGIVVVDSQGRRARRVRHQGAIASSLAADAIRALLRDVSGTVWVGTYNGLEHTGRIQSAVLTVLGGDGSTGLSGNDVDAVYTGPDGQIWLGQYVKGLDIVDPEHNRIHQLPFVHLGSADTLPDRAINSFGRGPDGQIAIATDVGLYLAASDGSRLNRVETIGRNPHSSVNALNQIEDTMWLGGRQDGLWALQMDAQHRTAVASEIPDVTDKRTSFIGAQAPGQLWVASMTGLSLLDTRTRSIKRVDAVAGENPNGLAGFVSTIVQDNAGRTWVGIMGAGIDILPPGDPIHAKRVRHLGRADGLPDANVDTLLRDARGRIWASTDNGLAVIDPDTFAIRALDQSDGVELTSYYTNAGAVTSHQELVFGGVGGITVVRPDRLGTTSSRPPVVITEIRVGDETIPPGRFNGLDASKVVVEAGHNKVSVEFAALDFSSPETNRYAYRLEGYDRDWIETDAQHRHATYTNLPPGDYQLWLRGATHRGEWVQRSAPIRFMVQPYWYQTRWFTVVVLLIALAAISLLVRWRTRILQQRQGLLEAEVRRQTAALQDANVELNEANSELEKRNRELSQQRDEIARLANQDPLTDLPTKRLALDRLKMACLRANRNESRAAVMFIDLDGFKSVNDEFGHDAGDVVLHAVGRRLAQSIRSADTAARHGGDEFLVVLGDGIDLAGIEQVARKIIEAISAPIPYQGQGLRVSASIGIALYPDHADSVDGLLKEADRTMYAVKRRGKNGFEVAPQRPEDPPEEPPDEPVEPPPDLEAGAESAERMTSQATQTGRIAPG